MCWKNTFSRMLSISYRIVIMDYGMEFKKNQIIFYTAKMLN